MDKCEVCGEEVLLPFRCNYCQSLFCAKHRLPESHNCSKIPARAPLGSAQVRKEIAIANAEREHQSQNHNLEKRELPTFRFNKNTRKKTTMRFPNRRRKK